MMSVHTLLLFIAVIAIIYFRGGKNTNPSNILIPETHSPVLEKQLSFFSAILSQTKPNTGQLYFTFKLEGASPIFTNNTRANLSRWPSFNWTLPVTLRYKATPSILIPVLIENPVRCITNSFGHLVTCHQEDAEPDP